jgi:uncharacterized protein YkwD
MNVVDVSEKEILSIRPYFYVSLFLAFFLALATRPAAAQASGISSQQGQLLDLVNAERARAGLSPLKWDEHLAEAARVHAQKMADRGELSHQFTGEPGLGERAGRSGANFSSVAENVAYADDVSSLHQGLMQSPHHRVNILNPDSNAIGIGFARRGNQLFVTEDFARLLTNYTGDQFTNEVIAAFNQLRRRNGMTPVDARADTRLQQAACGAKLEPEKIIKTLPGATDLAVFTASEPGVLPSTMQRAAADRTLRHMNIGVCFKPADKAGFSKYWVVAAFYPVP